jgi:hypothetical protein
LLQLVDALQDARVQLGNAQLGKQRPASACSAPASRS